jgi:hypothetical protein
VNLVHCAIEKISGYTVAKNPHPKNRGWGTTQSQNQNKSKSKIKIDNKIKIEKISGSAATKTRPL